MTYIIRKLEDSLTLEVCACISIFVVPLILLFGEVAA